MIINGYASIEVGYMVFDCRSSIHDHENLKYVITNDYAVTKV